VTLNELMSSRSAELVALEQEMVRETATTPKELLYARGTLRLYHYLPQTDDIYRVPLMLVMSIVSRPYVFDLTHGQSLIEYLVQAGFDVYLIDWGTPRPEHSSVSIDDYVADWIPDCISQVQRHSGEREISLLGYCLGGILTLLYAALEPKGPVKNLPLLTTPINSEGMEMQRQLATGIDADRMIDMLGNVPTEVVQAGFQIQRPLQTTAGQLMLMNKSTDREFIKVHMRLVRWGDEALPIPGETFRQMHHDIFLENKIVRGEFKVRGRKMNLRDIRVPVLLIWGEKDNTVPFANNASVRKAIPNAEFHPIDDAGHLPILERAAFTDSIILSWLEKQPKEP